jgi:uncharacterized protein
MRGLLDVNALIAIADPLHVLHRRAYAWLGANAAHGFATCAITQLGAVRILSQPGYSNTVPMATAFARLDEICGLASHTFWSADLAISNANAFDRPSLQGHRQLTDVYLLGLAVKHGGAFITFDQQIPLSAVHGAARKHLVVI